MSDSLYRGCVIPARLPFVESAAMFIIRRLGLDIKDMGEMPCCIEPVGLRSLNHDVWLDVSSYICSKSSGRLVTICDGCSVSLKGSVDEKGEGPEITGLMEVLYEQIERIKGNIVNPIGMRLAIFPGCHCEYMFSEKGMDAYKVMSAISEAIGVTPLMPSENLCCGGGLSSVDDTVAKAILEESVDSFRSTGAEGVVTSCPFCFMQFDMVARYRAYSMIELVAKAMGWEVDTERYHRGKV